MAKDNSQEPMITSNSPSLEKGREKVYYSSNPAFYVGIDCIIFGFYEGEISLLLLKRNFEPAMGEWSLMGGFVQNNESVDDAAKRVLHELTGLENVYMEQVLSLIHIYIGTYFSPRSIHVSISKLNQVECILNIVIQITNCYVSFRIIILILAGKSAIQNRQRCRTHFFRQQEIFVESQSIALIIIREESVSKSILPTIFI